jgi:hypothetical protein
MGFLTNINRAAAIVVTMKSNPDQGGRDEFKIEVRNSPQWGAHARNQRARQTGAQRSRST